MAKKKDEKKLQQDWNSISGVMKIYGQEVGKGSKSFIKFSTSLGVKDEDDEYVNAYLSVFFSRKCSEAMEDAAEGENWIRVDKAFMTVEYYTNKNNKLVVKPAIMVTECELLA